MSSPVLQIEDVESVRVITINRPQQLNALNQEVISELNQQFVAAQSDASVRVAVLTGAGNKAFAAGADIKELQTLSPHEATEVSRRGQEMMQRIREIDIPVIAAVNGYALGGGLELALACDFIYAADSAVLGLVEIELGLIPGYGGVWRLMDRIGESLAREALFTSRKFTASESLTLRLVNRVFPQEALLDETLKIAAAVAKKSSDALGRLKTLIEASRECGTASSAAIQREAFGLAFASPDAKEGMAAFIEKRRPESGQRS